MSATVYLVPCPIAEEATHTLPPQVLQTVQQCEVFFVENERSARRFLKKIWKEMVIDNYRWFTTGDEQASSHFRNMVKEGKQIGIISEAGCPGVADPGQALVAIAQEMNARVVPITGPSSILLALMASGMNGQHFRFSGYLPIDNHDRIKALKALQAECQRTGATHIFIETPYRNNQLLQAMLQHLDPKLRLCIAVDITGPGESVRTLTIGEWKKQVPELHKRTAIFLIGR